MLQINETSFYNSETLFKNVEACFLIFLLLSKLQKFKIFFN